MRTSLCWGELLIFWWGTAARLRPLNSAVPQWCIWVVLWVNRRSPAVLSRTWCAAMRTPAGVSCWHTACTPSRHRSMTWKAHSWCSLIGAVIIDDSLRFAGLDVATKKYVVAPLAPWRIYRSKGYLWKYPDFSVVFPHDHCHIVWAAATPLGVQIVIFFSQRINRGSVGYARRSISWVGTSCTLFVDFLDCFGSDGQNDLVFS